MITISIRDLTTQKYYRATVSLTFARRHDNGALISCGLTVPDDLSKRSLQALIARKQATEITYEQWNHSGCQSSCVLRGAKECRW